MSSSEFAEWLAFDSISPGDPEREDIRTALIAMTIANTHRGKGKAYKLNDFMLRFKKRWMTPQTSKNIEVKLRSWLTGLKSQQHNKKK